MRTACILNVALNAAVLLTGCGRDDSGPPSDGPNVAGVWEKTTGGDSQPETIEFTPGGHVVYTANLNGRTKTEQFTYSIVDGHTLEFNKRDGSLSIEGYFSIEVVDGKDLIITDSPNRSSHWNSRFSDYTGRFSKVGPVEPDPHDEEGGLAGAGESTTTNDGLSEIKSRLLDTTLKHSKIARLLKQYREQKQQLVGQIRELGVSKPDDLKDNPKAKTLALELAELAQQVELLERAYERSDVDIVKTESLLRRLERRAALKQATVSEQDVVELRTLIAGVDDQLTQALEDRAAAPQDLQVETVLEQELK